MEDYPLGQSPLLRDVIAHGTLANAGSVMARPQLPQWRQNLPQTLGPTAGTGLQAGMDLLDKLLAFGPSPLDAAGSGSGAIFGPIRTAAQKQAVRALWRADPDAVKAINVDPDILQLNVPSSVGGGAQRIGKEGNALGTYTDNRISIAPTTMKGLYPSGKKGASLPEVMLHEGQHFLNEPRIYDPFLMNPKESFNMAQRIFPFLTPGATTNALEGAAQNKLPQIALDEALAYLSGSMTRNPKLRGDVLYDALKVRPTGQRPVLTPETLDKAIGKARDASSTNLFQNILAEARNKLGIGPRQALPTSGSRLPSLTPEELLMYDKLPRAGRSFKSPEDIARAKAGEQLPALGSALPDIPRPTASAPENLGAFEGIRSKLGLPEREALVRHGTDPQSAVGVIKEGLRPGSSISKVGGRDYEGYPVTFEFDDALRGAQDYSSPFGKTMHEGAARTGEAITDLRRVFFDPSEYSFKEDALDIFRQLRQGLNETGRKGLKIESANWNDDLQKWNYGGKLSLRELPSFSKYVQKTSDRSLQRMFDETLDNMWNVPDARKAILDKRLDRILEEMERRGFGAGGK